MKLLLTLLLVCMSIILRCEGDAICKDVTVSNCDTEDGSLIDSLYALDSIMCQDLCHSISNCHFFRYEKSSSEENCQLLESSYRETCMIVAAPIYRDVNACLTSTDETCDKIIGETCQYLGNEIYTTPPGSTLDSNSCDELCIDYERLDCSYWMFNKDAKQCTIYDSTNSDCSFVSGPEQPSIESCIDGVSSTALPLTTTTTKTSKETTRTSTTTPTTTFSGDCDRNSDCPSDACDTTTNLCYGYKPEHECADDKELSPVIYSFSEAVALCNQDSSCGCIQDSQNDGDYALHPGTSTLSRSYCTAWVKN